MILAPLAFVDGAFYWKRFLEIVVEPLFFVKRVVSLKQGPGSKPPKGKKYQISLAVPKWGGTASTGR